MPAVLDRPESHIWTPDQGRPKLPYGDKKRCPTCNRRFRRCDCCDGPMSSGSSSSFPPTSGVPQSSQPIGTSLSYSYTDVPSTCSECVGGLAAVIMRIQLPSAATGLNFLCDPTTVDQSANCVDTLDLVNNMGCGWQGGRCMNRDSLCKCGGNFHWNYFATISYASSVWTLGVNVQSKSLINCGGTTGIWYEFIYTSADFDCLSGGSFTHSVTFRHGGTGGFQDPCCATPDMYEAATIDANPA